MKKIILFCLFALILFGCVKNNPKPVWLNLSVWTLLSNNDPSANGHPTYMGHNFSDAWVYVDDKLIGVFEVPCKIPVLISSGAKSVRIYPTVRNNGISATKKIYPFVEVFEQSLDVTEGETYTLDLKTKYYTETRFWLEEFTDNSPDVTAESGTITVENDPAIAISGKYGHIHLNTENPIFLAKSDAIPLPGSGAEVYLEINYRTNIALITSLIGIQSDGTIKLNPNITLFGNSNIDVWKKVYIDLRELVSTQVNATTFQQEFDAMIQDGSSARDIYIDNIRLVHF